MVPFTRTTKRLWNHIRDYTRPADPTALGLLDVPAAVAALRESARRLSYMKHPTLTYLFWEATRRCNLRCRHCGSSCENVPVPGEMGTLEVLKVLDTICEDFDTSGMTLAITGGEPLLRPDLEEVLERATAAGMGCGMVTNATLATVSRTRDLVAAGLRVASVSLDGPKDLHEAIRGAGTFERTLAGMRALREGGTRLIEVITCVRPANLPVLPELEALLRGLGVNAWRLVTIDRMGRAAQAENSDTWLEPSQVRQLLDFVRTRRQSAPAPQSPRFNISYSCGGYLGPAYEFEVRDRDRQCFAGVCVASLLADGQVSACPSLPRSWAQGSVRQERFSTIWRERFQQHRTTDWRRTGPCAECRWFGACLGGGLHERLAQPDEFCWLGRQG